GDLQAVLLGLAVGVAVGLVNGLGVAVFQAQPLIMTLGMALVVTGGLTVYSQFAVTSVPSVPGFIHTLGAGTVLGVVPVCLPLSVSAEPRSSAAAATIREPSSGH